MSAGSQKKLATRNKSILLQLRYIAGTINLLAVIAVFYFNRPSRSITYILLSTPSFILQYVLESSGLPKLGPDGKIISSGADIMQKGSLFEYCFDIIYLTWILDVLMIVFGSNKVWWAYALIPGFAIYKISGFILPFFKKSGGGAQQGTADESSAGSSTKKDNSGLSKRQQKLKARQEKGPGVKYR
ncbi:hypothetical protein KGF57_001512 [Candida theae]|uniref:DUF788-domain-containing protein n=1 Tax=Candida theae TaxID=1198502 RepID=A0AAD5FZT9_9ASCO|nr:uncharacterized protein KGF57_001512 [Candida theae]KAI5961973.1 hypothetical protein KGF57_001512 [Candida theae]